MTENHLVWYHFIEINHWGQRFNFVYFIQIFCWLLLFSFCCFAPPWTKKTDRKIHLANLCRLENWLHIPTSIFRLSLAKKNLKKNPKRSIFVLLWAWANACVFGVFATTQEYSITLLVYVRNWCFVEWYFKSNKNNFESLIIIAIKILHGVL